MSKKLAFTLIELLVVIAIIGILSGLIVVAMGGVTQKANVAKAQIFANSLRNSLLLNTIAEWKFDGPTSDGATATTDDLKNTWGSINNGQVTVLPKVRTNSNCVNGSCLQFDSNTQYVDFGNDSSLSMGTGDETISMWVKFDNPLAVNPETLIRSGANAGGVGYPGYWIFRATNSSRLYFYFSDGTATRITDYLSADKTLVNDNWYNVVIVFNRASVAQAYINGVKQTGVSISAQAGNVQNYADLTLGLAGGNDILGKMDEVRIYNVAMLASKIKENYYIGLNNLFVNGSVSKDEYMLSLKKVNNWVAESN